MAQRVTQDAGLTLGEGTPNARVTQDAVMVLATGTPNARVTQNAVLVLADSMSSVIPAGGAGGTNIRGGSIRTRVRSEFLG
jgi:hypothetical protein